VLSRAEGNPLYAEEYVRMLQDRGFLVRRDGTWRLVREGDLPLPETVHGMIAARLDALSREEKELVQDAAVIGKVFWPGGVAAMGDRSPFALEDPLHALERKEFIRRERRSAVAGETQYAFLHALVRDVAYGQIPRGQRVHKHRLAAEWIEALSHERSEDRAEMLAHHYRQALEIARAAGVDDTPLRAPARRALIEATERASRLYAMAAIVDLAEAALELTEDDDRARPLLQFRLASAYQQLDEDRFDLGLAARDGFLAHGDVESAALVDILLARMYWLRGNSTSSQEHLGHAASLVTELPLSYAKVRVLAQQARDVVISSSPARATELGEHVLPLAEELGDDELLSHVLNTVGLGQANIGDPDGLDQLRRSVEYGEASNSPDAIHTALNNLANSQWRLGDLEGASESLARARRMNERFGSAAGLAWLDIEDMLDHDLRGNWDESLARANAFIEALGSAKDYLVGPARDVRTVIFTARGELAAAEAEAELILAHARVVTGEQLAPALVDAARAFRASGRGGEADELLAELLRDHREDLGSQWLRELPLLLAELDRSAEYLAATKDSFPSPWLDAGTAVARGAFAEGADAYETMGARATEAWARLLAAEASGDAGQAQRALEYFRSVRATPYVRRCEAVLGASTQAIAGDQVAGQG
jgi:hypothetical protein